MSKLEDRSQLIMDGTYVNVPDLHIIQPSKNIGLREYNNGILVHNWFEERTPFEKKEFQNNTTHKTDFIPFPNAQPDVVIRRNMIGKCGGIGSNNLIGHHAFDSSKNMITTYDETINKRARPGPEVPVGQQFPEKRTWKIIRDEWVPEKVDFTLQDAPTNWGLVDKKRNDHLREKDKYASQLSDITEYSDKFQKHDNYLTKPTTGIPKDISSSYYDINVKLNNVPKYRATDGSLRENQARDVLDSVYSNMLAKSERAPRTYYYLGKVPTNGALDVYSMKDFETLTPVIEKIRANNINKIDLSVANQKPADLKNLDDY